LYYSTHKLIKLLAADTYNALDWCNVLGNLKASKVQMQIGDISCKHKVGNFYTVKSQNYWLDTSVV
jgi:hypothetical protein